jgi:hypothetical protein
MTTLTDLAGPRLAAALALAKRGVPVFPCKVGGKAPATSGGFKDATTDPAQIERWWREADYNYGYRPADLGAVVLDIDLGADPADIAKLPPTYTVQTPSGGEHRYYLTALDFGNSRFAQRIDVRSVNGYVLGPGSVVAGKSYRLAAGSAPMAPLPESIAVVLRGRTEAAAQPVDEPDADPGPWAVEGARRWLEGLCERGEDPGRYVIAAALARNFGLTDATALELWEASGLRTASKSSGESLETKLAHARRYGRGELGEGVAFGCWLEHAGDDQSPAEKFGKFVAKGPPRRFKRTYPDDDRFAPPMRWLDGDNLFPSGPRIVVLYGEYNTLKTQFALAKALEIASGNDASVLYLATEGAHGIKTSRLPGYIAAQALDWRWLRERWWTIAEPAQLTIPSELDTLIDDVQAEGFNPALIVVDVLTAATDGADLNSPKDGNRIMNAAQKLANAFCATVVLVCHTGKVEARGIVGSYAFAARADVVLELSRQGSFLAVRVVKVKDGGAAGRSLNYRVREVEGAPPIIDGRAGDGETASDARATEISETLKQHGVTAGNGWTDRQMAEVLGTTAATVRGWRHRNPARSIGSMSSLEYGKPPSWRWHL